MLISFAYLVSLPLLEVFAISLVFNNKNLIDNASVMSSVKKNIFRAVALDWASLLLLAVLIIPLCLVLYAFSYFSPVYLSKVLFLVLFLLSSLIGFGIRVLGMQIMIAQNKMVFQSIISGLQMLWRNLGYFLPVLFIVDFIPQALWFSVRLIGAQKTGIDMFSMPVAPIMDYVKAIFQILNVIQLELKVLDVLSILILPFSYVFISFAYLNLHSNIIVDQPLLSQSDL
jgi:hypothetical protein